MENNNNKIINIKNYLANDGVKKRIEDLLKNKSQQFILNVTSLINQNRKLEECDPASLLQGCLTVTALDLPLNQNLGFAYIIPYKNNKTGITSAQVQFGYKAFIQLALRSGQFRTISASPVYEGQIKTNDPLRGIVFDWDNKVSNKVIGYASYFELLNGFEKTFYMSVEELQAHGKRYSQEFKKYNSGMWVDQFDAMAQKTVIKLLLSKFAPLSVEMQKAVESDQAILTDEEVVYPDNAPVVIQNIVEDKDIERIIKQIVNCSDLDLLNELYETITDKYSDNKLIINAYNKKKAELEK